MRRIVALGTSFTANTSGTPWQHLERSCRLRTTASIVYDDSRFQSDYRSIARHSEQTYIVSDVKSIRDETRSTEGTRIG